MEGTDLIYFEAREGLGGIVVLFRIILKEEQVAVFLSHQWTVC
jgi:hypothetical protein